MFKQSALKITALLALLILGVGLFAFKPAKAVSTNLVPNPSVEQVTATKSGNKPNSWASRTTGTNTSAFTSTTTGHTGSHAVQVNTSKYTNGEAEWYFTPVSVKANTKYTFSDWYQGNVASKVAIVITNTSDQESTLSTTSLAASSAWKQAAVSFTTPANVKTVTVRHYISGVGNLMTDDFSLTEVTAPAVQLTAPAAGTTVSGSKTVTANATDDQQVTKVQFTLDGQNLGTADTTAPYSVAWDTTKVANGNHVLSAVATNNSGLTTTAANVTVNVQNTLAAPNLISNPGFETASGNQPANWLSSNWGTNTTAFSYLNTGHTGNHSAKVQMTSYTDGAANWYYNDIPVSSGQSYKYENWYQSNVDTEVDAEVVMNDGTTQYFWLGNVPASTSWTKFSTTFTVPAGAKSMAIYQILGKTGYIVSDDYYLGVYTPVPLNRAMVSVTFDDGWTNQYTNALPMLQQLGIKSTFYIISGELNDTPNYMTSTQVKDLFNKGHEIGSHSVSHPDLTTVSQTKLVNEMANSKTTLQNLIGVPVTNFAYPFGAYNSNTLSVGSQYYQSQRTVNGGLNTKDTFNITQLKIYEVDSNISQAQVQGWINAAIAQKAWLILVYHEVATTPAEPDDALYTTQPTDFNAEMNYLKNSGVATLTVNQAINEILAQL